MSTFERIAEQRELTAAWDARDKAEAAVLKLQRRVTELERELQRSRTKEQSKKPDDAFGRLVELVERQQGK